MGIYVQSFADLPSTPSRDGWAARICGAGRDWAAERGISDVFYATTDDKGCTLTLHPAGGHVRFDIDASRVTLDAKTSVTGPGFHAALVEMTDYLDQKLGIRWRWDAGGDETGYALHRDRQRLQAAFADQFAAYCELYRDRRDSSHTFVLNLPTDIAFGEHSGVATPMGPRPLEFFIYDDPAQDEQKAQTIFPWWSDEIDEEFWRSTLTALLWSEVEWRAPRTAWEQFVAQAALHASTKATLDRDIGLGVAELLQLQQATEMTPPSTDGVGWRRRARGYYLPGPWRVVLPGYFVDQIEDEGSTVCVWFGDEEIRASSITATPKTPGPLVWSKRFSDAREYETANCKYRVDATVRPSAENPGFGIAWAEFQASDPQGQAHLLTLSLFARLTAQLPQRLEEIARSVWFNPPQVMPSKAGDA